MASIYKRKNGTYCIRVSHGMLGGRKNIISATYKPVPGMSQAAVDKDVKKFADKFEKAVREGIYVPGAMKGVVDPFFPQMKLGDFITQYYYPRTKEKLSPNTVRFYRKVCGQFLIPTFGTMALCEISHHHLQMFIDYLAYSPDAKKSDRGGKTLSPTTVKRYASVFMSVMTEAVRMGYIEENPLRHESITYPRQKKTELEIYSPDEVQAFFSALSDEPPMTRLLLLTPLLLGLRRAEIVALKWEDVSFDEGNIRITKSAYKVNGEKQGLKAPKSQCGVRKVFFPEVYRDELLTWKAEQEKQRTAAGDEWKEQGFIFTNETGGMISVYTPTRICEKLQERHGLRHLKLHGLRHTCGSLMVAAGTDPETVRDVLGHESVRTTDIYLHAFDHRKKQAAQALGYMIEGGKKREA